MSLFLFVIFIPMFQSSCFKETCAYCYSDISKGLSVYECTLSYCDTHSSFHSLKCGCDLIFYSCLDGEGNVRVSINPEIENQVNENEARELESKLNIRYKNGMRLTQNGVECKHIFASSNIKKTVKKDTASCSSCENKDNLWICLECGNIGCGRKQPGSTGNGHALDHFNKFGHCNSVLLSSIEDNNGDAYCYKCEDFVQNPLALNINVENQSVKKFYDIKDGERISSNHVGLVNEGQNCYASSVLHILDVALKRFDLSSHQELCFNIPTFCICCQLIKVLNEMKTAKNEKKSIRIKEFLASFFIKQPSFSFTKQQDCAEFFTLLLDEIELYEKEMTISNVTDTFKYEIEEKIKCCECSFKRSTTNQGVVLYAPFSSSVKSSVEKAIGISAPNSDRKCNNCECGLIMCSKVTFNKLPEYLVVYMNRNTIEGNDNVKIADLTDPKSFYIDLDHSCFSFELVGAVIHKGDNITEGHYTWFCKDDEKFIEVNDADVVSADESLSHTGSMFLYRTRKVTEKNKRQ